MLRILIISCYLLKAKTRKTLELGDILGDIELRIFRRGVLALIAALLGGLDGAVADEVSEKIAFFGESRLRLETADEDAQPSDAVGLTLLLRPAVEYRFSSRLSALVEGEALFAIVDDFNDGTGNRPDRPIILDPNGLELNRALLQYAVTPQTFVTLGRQRLSIDDQRFIGPAAFRQNDQTFDGVHVSSSSFGASTFQAGYFNRVNRPLGADNPAGRFRGDSYYFNGNIPTPFGRLGAFHYAFDLGTDGPTLQDNIFSSRTSGFRLDGRYHKDEYGVDWEAAFARQRDFADNPTDYSANYWLLGVQGFIGPARLIGRFESFGADEEQSFQTPLGTLHRFQGAADIFLITPEEGLQDLEFAGRWNFGRTGPFRNISTAISYHLFEPETGGPRFGQEVDFDVSVSFDRFTVAFIAAYYDADTFATDTRRFFLSLTHRF